MTACIISSNIYTKKAGTGTVSLIQLSLWYFQSIAKSCLKSLYCHAAGTVCTKLSQLIPFCAGANGHAISSGNFNHSFPQVQPVFFCNRLCGREIPLYFFVNVDKTDYTRSLSGTFGSISYKNIAFFDSITKPFRIKRRNVRSHTCLNNHIFSYLSFLPISIRTSHCS